MWETWVRSLGWEDPLEKGTLPTPVFRSVEFLGLYNPWGRKELDRTKGLSVQSGKYSLSWWVVIGVKKGYVV